MSTGNVKKHIKSKGYESINRNMLQDEENLSLEAIGLLANLTSYPDTWVIHKTELYKRYKKSGRRKVERAWAELVEQNYIVQLRKRNGRTYDYIYYHSQERFTPEEIKQIELDEGCPVWDGKVSNKVDVDESHEETQKNSTVQNVQSKITSVSTVQNEQSKLNSTKRTHKKLNIDEINHQDKIDTKDTTDTKIPDISLSVHDGDLKELEKEKMKEQYMTDGFFANQDQVPPNIGKMLKVFSNTPEEAKGYYNLILLAKKKAEEHTDEIIWLEHESELEQQIIQTFSRSVRKIEKERNVENPNGYIYKALFDLITETVTLRARRRQKEIQRV